MKLKRTKSVIFLTTRCAVFDHPVYSANCITWLAQGNRMHDAHLKGVRVDCGAACNVSVLRRSVTK